MPQKTQASRRRARCDQCQGLTTTLLDYWTEVKGRKQRKKLCPSCYEGVAMFDDIQQRKVIR